MLIVAERVCNARCKEEGHRDFYLQFGWLELAIFLLSMVSSELSATVTVLEASESCRSPSASKYRSQ